MGVTTTAYSITPLLMRKIRANTEILDIVFGSEEDAESPYSYGKLEMYEFDKRLYETNKILRECGYKKTYARLDTANSIDHSFDVWVATPSQVKAIVKELEPATHQALKAEGLAKEITDYDGNLISADDYDYYVGDIEEIKKFFGQIAGQGNYLLFAEG
jgi:hypothetical protein